MNTKQPSPAENPISPAHSNRPDGAAASAAVDEPRSGVSSPGQSLARRSSPRLSPEGLTVVLIIMCIVPVVTIFVLWSYLPPVFEGKLACNVQPMNLPPEEFYLLPYNDRKPVAQGEIIVQNQSDTDWTHINIQVNTFYQIYDIDTLRAGESRTYVLSRFISRTGARFDLMYNPLKDVRVYARRPKGDRATYYRKFWSPGEEAVDAAQVEGQVKPTTGAADQSAAPAQ